MELTDGRVARRDRNRDAVVAAALALCDAGFPDPSLEEITARSGVSQRSVFRYFDTLDELRSAIVAKAVERSRPLAGAGHEPGAGTAERVRQVVDGRIRVFRSLEPVASLVASSASAAAAVSSLERELDEVARRQLDPDLSAMTPSEARDSMLAVSVLVSFGSWSSLTGEHGRTPAQARKIWTRALTALAAGA